MVGKIRSCMTKRRNRTAGAAVPKWAACRMIVLASSAAEVEGRRCGSVRRGKGCLLLSGRLPQERSTLGHSCAE